MENNGGKPLEKMRTSTCRHSVKRQMHENLCLLWFVMAKTSKCILGLTNHAMEE
jgi:hypothetical protein